MNDLMKPMLVQYLVALCCQSAHAKNVDVILGDMVLDESIEKKRDVDVTVTIRESSSANASLKAFEVKKESKPLDVATVEQLCAKLQDMKSVTYRAIVSSSGYTDSGIKKALSKGVELFSIMPWNEDMRLKFKALNFSGLPDKAIVYRQCLLCWLNESIYLETPSAKEPFTLSEDSPIFSGNGKIHKKFKSFRLLRQEFLLRSTESIYHLPLHQGRLREIPPNDSDIQLLPTWNHSHTLDLANEDIFVQANSELMKVTQVVIDGLLQWQIHHSSHDFYLIQNEVSKEILSGALVSLGARDGTMNVLTFQTDSREIGIRFVALSDKQMNMIKELRLKEV